MMMTSAEGRGCRAERKWEYVQYLNHVLVQVQMRSLPLFRTRALPHKAFDDSMAVESAVYLAACVPQLSILNGLV